VKSCKTSTHWVVFHLSMLKAAKPFVPASVGFGKVRRLFCSPAPSLKFAPQAPKRGVTCDEGTSSSPSTPSVRCAGSVSASAWASGPVSLPSCPSGSGSSPAAPALCSPRSEDAALRLAPPRNEPRGNWSFLNVEIPPRAQQSPAPAQAQHKVPKTLPRKGNGQEPFQCRSLAPALGEGKVYLLPQRSFGIFF